MAGHDGFTRYTVRIPDELYRQLQIAANEAGKRSLNAEIVERLQKSLHTMPVHEDALQLGDYRGLLKDIQKKLDRIERNAERLGIPLDEKD